MTVFGDMEKVTSAYLSNIGFKGFDLDTTWPPPQPDLSQITDSYREGWQQLIVIGNGFDLECGLKSSYEDFFNPRREKVYPSQEYLNTHDLTWQKHVKENKITVWDVILEECADYLWNDIEKAIEVWIVPSSPKGESHFQRLLSILNPNIESNIDTKIRKKFPWRSYIGRGNDDDIEASVARFILQTYKSKRGKCWNEERLYNCLRNQLSLLEDEFRAYLQKQIDQNANYFQASWKLIRDLLDPEYPSNSNIDVLTTVLNFNYTNPIIQKPWELPLRAINIHGELTGEIVFGIDGKDHLDNPLVAPFTKTYRLLGLHSSNRFSLFETVGSDFNFNDSLNVIKFYGHSLSDPDYSYFQAIFDEVNLYSGNTQLIFFYNPQVKNADTETSNRVSHLLTEYGKTMDNKDHGKNLMHKLILEGRLSVLELERTGN